MKETLNTARVGLFFLLGLAVIWIVYETLREGRLFTSEGYEIYAHFEDVKMLRTGDDVRASGVRVGRVLETRLRNGGAEAVLEIADDVLLPIDSTATIGMAGMLGGNFVGIDLGLSDDSLVPGSEIGTRHTADLGEVFAQLGSVTGKMEEFFAALTGTSDDPGPVDNLNAMIEENRAALKESVDNIRAITTKINEGDGTLARLINDGTAYDNLVAAVDEIGRAAENASTLTESATDVVARIRSGEGTLGKLIYDDQVSRELEALVVNLREVSDRLASGEGTLGRLLVDDGLYNEVEAVVRKAERTLDGLNEQGPITAVGVAGGALF